MNLKKIYLVLVIIIVLLLCSITFIAAQYAELKNLKNENNSLKNKEQTLNEENNSLKNQLTLKEEEIKKLDSNKNSEENNTKNTSNVNINLTVEEAIIMVKKDLNNSTLYSYSYEDVQSNGSYIIAVRNISDTTIKAWYYVEPKTGRFTKEVMN